MDYNYQVNRLVKSETTTQFQEKSLAQFPFLCLCIFALLRPILCMQYFAEFGIFGTNFLELFSIAISYLLIIAFLFNVFKLRYFRLDFINVIGLLFGLYLLLTIFRGSYIRETSRLILPIAVFFCVRTTITEKKQIKILLSLIAMSYIIPLIGSTWVIMHGKSVGKVVYLTGLIRYEGLYLLVHTFAHSMFIFIFSFLFYMTLNKEGVNSSRLFISFLYFLSLLAIFNLFKSYTRNVWIGLLILVTFYLAGRKNYIILVSLFLGLITIAIMSSSFHTIFFDFIEPLEGQSKLANLGAGRLGIWTSVLQKFDELPLDVKLIGIGIGENEAGFGISRGHNDLISLLYTTGIIGFSLYLTLLFRLLYDIIRSHMDRRLKYLFLGFLFAVIFMNIASNSYLSRIELGQYFYFFMGSFYCLNEHLSGGILS